ncbi:unnamed protein product [Trichobilharzia szidati]|nr:unnamed protein product [Trichobilharzia szidati]
MNQTKSKRPLSQLQKHSYETNRRLRDNVVKVQKYEAREENLRQNVLESRRCKMKKMMEYLRKRPADCGGKTVSSRFNSNIDCNGSHWESDNSWGTGKSNSKEDASDQLEFAMSLLALGEITHESITSKTPTPTSNTHRAPLKFVISSQTTCPTKSPTSQSILTSNSASLSIPQTKKDSIHSKTNIPSWGAEIHSDQIDCSNMKKSFQENQANLSETDEEISSLSSDMNASPVPCVDVSSVSLSSSQRTTPIEDLDDSISLTDMELSNEKAEMNSVPKSTRSILKSRSISPRICVDHTTYEFSPEDFIDPLYGPRDSVELASVRFQIGYAAPPPLPAQPQPPTSACDTIPKSEVIESPRTSRKTVRFADETNDIYQTVINPIFSNVFPLKVTSESSDFITSVYKNDSIIPSAQTMVAENEAIENNSTPPTSSQFISVSIGFPQNEFFKFINTNTMNPTTDDTEVYSEKNEYTTLNNTPKLDDREDIYTSQYETLKPSEEVTTTTTPLPPPASKTQSKVLQISSKRINKLQGYADLMIGRPKLNKDFLIPRQQLLTYRVSISPLFHQQQRPSNVNRPMNSLSNNHISTNLESVSSSPSNLFSDMSSRHTSVRSPINTMTNSPTYDTTGYSSSDTTVNIETGNNDDDAADDDDVNLPDYEGINIPFENNNHDNTTTTHTNFSSLPTTTEEISKHQEKVNITQPIVSDLTTCTKNVIGPKKQQIQKEFRKQSPVICNGNNTNHNLNNGNQDREHSEHLLVNVQQRQLSKSSLPLYTTSARLLSRRPRVCEPSDVNQNLQKTKLFTSTCEFESSTSENNSHEILSKVNDPPVNNSNTYWFRLHTDGYSEKDDFPQTENSTQNDYDNLDSIHTSSPPPPSPPTSTSRQPVNSFVTNVFGSRLECSTYSSSQIHDVTSSLNEFLNSERECQQHQHQTRQQSQSRHKLKDESKINQALKPIHVNTEIFNHSTPRVKKRTKVPSALSVEEENLVKSLERLNKRLNEILTHHY